MKKFFYLICIFFLSGCVGNSSSDNGAGSNNSNTVTSISNLSITSFILGDTPATIIGNNISVVMPYGTNLNSLVATYVATAESITVNGIAQVNKVTANNFNNLVIYKLSDKDGNIRNYSVNVTVADASAKDIVSFSLNNVLGVINGDNIYITMPYGSDLKSLAATYITTGSLVTVGNTPQLNGITPNNFTNPVIYSIKAYDGTIHNYTVTVNVATNTAKDITSFYLNGVQGVINGSDISVTMPSGTNVKSLIAGYITTGSLVNVNGVPQLSGITPNNFTNPIAYTIKAQDGTTKNYTVTVNVATKAENNITAFSLNGVNGVISGTNITVTMPYATNTKSLNAAYITSGISVMVNGVAQINGVTPNNFSNPITYAVQAEDGTVRNYKVTVTIASNSAKDITVFYLNGTQGVINNTNITVAMPSGTNISSLNAGFNTTGIAVTVNNIVQVNGVTPNNFTNSVTYVVSAQDGTTKNYTVTVTIATGNAKDITSFSLNGVQGKFTDGFIEVAMPYGTPLVSLVASYITTGKSVLVNDTLQINGVTGNNFITPVTYTVQAADGTTKLYNVSVTTAARSDNDITSFYLSGVKGTIDGDNISVFMPYGVDISSLIAGYTTTGTIVRVNNVEQINGITPNNFNYPVTYVVQAEDGSKHSYVVNVTSSGEYIAVGTNGTIVTSLDGMKWDILLMGTLPLGNYLYGITVSNNGQYVAVGTNGVAMSSYDGVTWRLVASNLASSYLWAVTVSNGTGRFVAVGNNGYIATSVDGINWSKQSMSSMSSGEQALYGVAATNFGRFVAVGTNGKIVKSENGTTWTNVTSNTTETLLGIAVDNKTGRFVAVGTKGVIITSLDGNTWSALSSPLGNKVKFNAVTVSNTGRFVIAGSNNNAILTSVDGLNWTVSSFIEGSNMGYAAVTVSKRGEFVAVQTEGNGVASSADGINWNLESSALPYAGMYGIAAFN